MSNSGTPENPQSNDIVIRRPRLLLIIGGVALILLFYLSTQVIGVLYAMVFPPQPPIPNNVREISHENQDYGVDKWLYASDEAACDVLKFYQNLTDSCVIAPGRCGADSEIDIHTPGQHIARCTGNQTFSIFAMRWWVNIATGSLSTATTDSTEFSVEREVYWTGTLPQLTPTP